MEQTLPISQSLIEIQKRLDVATEKLEAKDFHGALTEVKEGITKSDCSICQLELSVLAADIKHGEEMCVLGADSCDMEREALILKTKELKEVFVEANK